MTFSIDLSLFPPKDANGSIILIDRRGSPISFVIASGFGYSGNPVDFNTTAALTGSVVTLTTNHPVPDGVPASGSLIILYSGN